MQTAESSCKGLDKEHVTYIMNEAIRMQKTTKTPYNITHIQAKSKSKFHKTRQKKKLNIKFRHKTIKKSITQKRIQYLPQTNKFIYSLS